MTSWVTKPVLDFLTLDFLVYVNNKSLFGLVSVDEFLLPKDC